MNILILTLVAAFVAVVLFGHALLLSDLWQRVRPSRPASGAGIPDAMKVPAE